MRRLGRLIGRLFQVMVVILILAILAVVVMGAVTTQRGWPQTTGTIVIDGLHHPATVIRDGAGIIQITADDRHDLFLAQGYVHAQERMWQMEVSRRIGAGRLSELFGKSQVDRDKYIRTLGWRVAAQRDLDAMSADSKAILQAYSDGVNAWITEHDGKLATPFVVAGLLSGSGGIGGYTLEPWTPLDTMTWQKVQAWSLGGNADSEVFRLLADAKLGDAAKTDELFPAYDPSRPIISPTDSIGDGGANPGQGDPGPDDPGPDDPGAAPGAPSASPATSLAGSLGGDNAAALADLAHLGASISEVAGFDQGGGLVGDHGVGSNNWVVAGSKTASGKPLLANDPHLGFGMPSVWIMNGLHCRTVSADCPWDVVGVTFPGAPAVVLGHNGRIAWGATNVNPDTQDLFAETPDPADPTGHYLSKGRSVAYEIRRETIKVAGGADVELDVRSSDHGPILSDVDSRLKDGPVLALKWTTISEVDLALETFFKIDVATSFEEFRAAFDGYGSPSQNFVYADVEGHIGYVLPGLIPIRGGAATGERVRDGASGADDWTGFIPRDQLPWQLDPAAGMIVSANNAPVDATYPFFIGNEFDPGYRAARITDLLNAAPSKLKAEDFRSIQMDTYVLRAEQMLHNLAALGPKVATDDGKLLWSRILQWDRTCPIDSVGCAAYMPVELALQRAIFDDELGPALAREWVGSTMAWEALRDALGDASSAWWTDTTPGAAAVSPAELAGKAIDGVAAELRKAYGDPDGWTWGRLHTVAFKEGTLGSSGIAPLEWYFDTPSRPVAGADGAIQNNYYQVSRGYPDPNDPKYVPLGITDLYGVTNGPSYRLTIDMNDLDGARIVITTGQSGNPFDGHYGDMISMWANGQTVPLPFSAGNVAASAAQTLTLSPP